MSHQKSLVMLAGAALGICGASAMAQNTTQDLSQATRAELQSDAAGRMSSLGQGADGATLHGQIQFRYNANSRDSPAPDEDFTHGFQTRRTKLWATGNIGDAWGYKVQGAFNRDGGAFILEDMHITYRMDDNWTLGMGQFKLPVLWEEVISSSKQLAADRSVVNEVFNPDRSQGVWGQYTADEMRFWVALSDGADTANSEYDSTDEADWAFSVRGEWKWAGEWDAFNQFTSFQGSDYAGKVGGAVHWQSGGSTGAVPAGTADVDVLAATLDVQVEHNGWNAYGAFVYVSVDPDGGTETDDMGFILQGGYFFDANWEGFARFDMVMPDDDAPGASDEFSTVTVGVNHYVNEGSHNNKFTADIQFFLDNQAASSNLVGANTGVGLLTDGEDGQVAFRAQWQLLF